MDLHVVNHGLCLTWVVNPVNCDLFFLLLNVLSRFVTILSTPTIQKLDRCGTSGHLNNGNTSKTVKRMADFDVILQKNLKNLQPWNPLPWITWNYILVATRNKRLCNSQVKDTLHSLRKCVWYPQTLRISNLIYLNICTTNAQQYKQNWQY